MTLPVANTSENRNPLVEESTPISRFLDLVVVSFACFYVAKAVLSYMEEDYFNASFFGATVPTLIVGRFFFPGNGYLQRVFSLADRAAIRASTAAQSLQTAENRLTGRLTQLSGDVTHLQGSLLTLSEQMKSVVERESASNTFLEKFVQAITTLELKIQELVQRVLQQEEELEKFRKANIV